MGSLLEIRRPIAVRATADHENLLLVVDPDEAAGLLHRLLALRFGIEPRFSVARADVGVSLRIEPGGPEGGRARLRAGRERWTVALSADELDFWCRFLTEVVLGVAAVDHIDLDVPEEPGRSLTLRTTGPFTTVDEAEARRRLGL